MPAQPRPALRIARRRPLSEEAYDRLRQTIAAGVLSPGAKLVEADLAAQLGISRTPLREAFRRLEAEGFLRRDTGGGIRVLGLSADEVDEIFRIRAVLEGLAARLAAQRADAAALSHLQEILEVASRCLRSGATDRLLELNTRFHDGITTLSGSPRLQLLLSSLRDRILLYRRITLEVPGEHRRSWRDHREILRALRARDGRGAEGLLVRHITRKKSAVLASMRGADRARTNGRGRPERRGAPIGRRPTEGRNPSRPVSLPPPGRPR